MIQRYDDQQGPYSPGAGTAALTVQVYRDTTFLIDHCRHDQDDTIGNFKIQMSHKKKLGTAIAEIHIHCIPCGANPASNQNVRFQVEYCWKNPTDTFPAATGWTTSTSDMVVSTTSQYIGIMHDLVVNLAAPASEGYSSFLLIRISRLGSSSGSDTYVESNPVGTAAANLAILGVDCHIIHDRLGSILEHSDA